MAGALGIVEGVKSEGQEQKEEQKNKGLIRCPCAVTQSGQAQGRKTLEKPGMGDSSRRCLLALLKVKNEEETYR